MTTSTLKNLINNLEVTKNNGDFNFYAELNSSSIIFSVNELGVLDVEEIIENGIDECYQLTNEQFIFLDAIADEMIKNYNIDENYEKSQTSDPYTSRGLTPQMFI